VRGHLAALAALRKGDDVPSDQLRKVFEAYAYICRGRRKHGAGDLTAALHRGERVATLHRQLLDLFASLITEAAAAGVVRNDISVSELAAYSIHALEAAGDASSDAAVLRLVDLVWSGSKPSS
jgi:hypothetical protein